MVLRGYRLQGTDLTGITQEIKKISMSVNKIRARTYAKLLGNEIAFLVDKIALNVYTRDPTVSIYECACSRTEEEIRVAQLQGLKTPYNLQVYGQVFTEADYTYFAISCMQNEFLKAFHRLEEYSVSESEYEDPNNSKTKLWKSLMEKTATPMTINFGNGIPQIAKDQIVYPTKKERCRTEARHQVCNRILNQVSFGKQGKKSKEICEQGRKEIRRIGEELCKNISNKTGTLSENRDDILKDYETSKEHRIILDRAVSIEGTITAFSVHPAGIIIGDGKPLSSYIPMYYNTQKEQWAVSCNMVEAEEIGLLKMDFLALKNLDIISESIRRIKKNYGIEIDPEKLPFEDEVFSHIFAEGRTSFIFQFESDGMKKMLREFKPDSFEDLILLVAAYRPGPMDFIPDIIAAKHGKKETHYIIPQLKEILGTTYGQCIYQEQLMSIFHECAGFSLGQADIIRRYMSKKKVDKFLKYKSQFVDGVVLNGADRTDAEALWESLEGFARYAFNRSHAAVYALISYMTAWLKFHYPVEFMCAILNASELDRISLAVKECSTMGVSVISPDINRSEMQFSDYNGKILYGLAAIKGISSASMQEMIEERKKGKFQNYCDLLARVSIGKADMEKLIVSGALDKCGFSRTALKNAILPAFAIKNKYIKDYTTEEICRKLKEEISLSQSSDKENWLLQLNEEKELLGAYISGHPLEQFKLLKADKSITPLSHAEAEKPQIYMGVISNIKEFRQRNDGIGVTFDLEDWDGLASCIVFAQHYKQVQKYIKDGNVIKVYGYFNKQDEESFSNELIARQIFPCHPYSNHVFISFQSRTEWPDVCQSLKPYLVEQGHPVIFYECDNGSIREHLQFKGKEIFLNDDVLHLKTDAIRNIRKLNF